jgi:DNA helicase-2/ATP-dependent DNA helicase PcrA
VNPAKLQIAIDKQIVENTELLAEIKPTLKKYESTRLKQEANIDKLLELKNIYISYQNELKQRELYDFNDMINFVLQKLEQDRELREYYAETFQFIMLDEYQDTNNAQNQIIDLILSVADEPNIMTV